MAEAPSPDANLIPRELIIGYVDTDEGRDALELGALLSEALAAQPLVATVVPVPDYLVALLARDEFDRAVEAEAAARFEQVRERLASLDPKTRTMTAHAPARALYELAESEQARLIVVGSAHLGVVGRTLLGDVGASLLHGAPCAVAVAPRGYAQRKEHRLQRVGVAFDGSSEASAALETAIALAGRLHGSLVVLTVSDPSPFGYGPALTALTAGDHETDERQHERDALEHAGSRVPSGLPLEKRLMEGDAASCLTAATQDLDLLIMGSRGYGALRRTFLGSVAGAVMRAAECPLIVLPRAAGEDPLGIRDPGVGDTASEP